MFIPLYTQKNYTYNYMLHKINSAYKYAKTSHRRAPHPAVPSLPKAQEETPK